MTETTPGGKRDWAGGAKSLALGWGLPIAALVAAAPLAGLAKPLVWMAALAWMALACLGNALRCRRLHGYFTGPFFLARALAALLHGHEVPGSAPRAGAGSASRSRSAASPCGGCRSWFGVVTPEAEIDGACGGQKTLFVTGLP